MTTQANKDRCEDAIAFSSSAAEPISSFVLALYMRPALQTHAPRLLPCSLCRYFATTLVAILRTNDRVLAMCYIAKPLPLHMRIVSTELIDIPTCIKIQRHNLPPAFLELASRFRITAPLPF